ncbi:MAG: NAD(P)/FAD-dependent oxidoreductase [Deltaproteobacteria bacterium]|nr:NAD(P)/FAD-dependent oxidoreductase [Deltaproteobacteria bacterium]
MSSYDVVILGAGGAGMMCAIQAAGRGRRVALLDHVGKVGGKILISGGGRCNFTNRDVSWKNYVSSNEHFCKSALSRFTPEDFIKMVQDHGILFHERKHGQLFCDSSAQQIIDMLFEKCGQAGARFFLGHNITAVKKSDADAGYVVATDKGDFLAQSVVVATGGLSIPKIGATGFGYELAKQFGLRLVERAPALDGFTFGESDRCKLEGFAGIALDSIVTCNGISFQENLLFTHVGLSGPVALQGSLHWYPGDEVAINFIPALSREELLKWFADRKGQKGELKNMMVELLPKRLAERFCELYLPAGVNLANLPKKDLELFCGALQSWTFVPAGTVGYGKAEVTRGGVNTDELSSKTLEAKKAPGLYFIGEVVDVTGWLGGFNFQWAWASGWAAGQAV